MAPQQPQQSDRPEESDRRAVPYEPGIPGVSGGDGPAGAPGGSAAGEGEVRAAELSAQRAAALAATEGFHPLRIRPYVTGPDGGPGEAAESTVRPLVGVAAGDVDGPATTDLGLFPAAYAEIGYAQEYRQEQVAGGALGGGGAGGDYAAEQAAEHGRHRRRRRGIVVAAAAVAASALAAGAVAMTGQVMGEEQGGSDRALPEPTSSVPDVVLPSDAVPASTSHAAPVTNYPMRATTSPAPRVSVTASATAPSSAAAPPSATASTPAPPPATTVPAAPPVTPTSPGSPVPPSAPPVGTTPAPSSGVLQLGDTGPAVTELQQRLTEVWVYRGRADGRFDSGVQAAVAMFQVWYGVHGDPVGVYGPHTREALLRATNHPG